MDVRQNFVGVMRSTRQAIGILMDAAKLPLAEAVQARRVAPCFCQSTAAFEISKAHLNSSCMFISMLAGGLVVHNQAGIHCGKWTTRRARLFLHDSELGGRGVTPCRHSSRAARGDSRHQSEVWQTRQGQSRLKDSASEAGRGQTYSVFTTASWVDEE